MSSAETPAGDTVGSISSQERRYIRVATIILLMATLLGLPLVSLFTKIFSFTTGAFVDYWNDYTLLLFCMLALFSLYVMLQERTKKEGNETSQIVVHTVHLLKYKHITVPVAVISLVSVLSWISGAPILGLELVNSMVIILGLLALFHLSFKFWPNSLKSNTAIQKTLIAVILAGGLIGTFFVEFTVLPVLAIVFMSIIFIGGIGSITIIDIMGTEASQYLKPRKWVHLLGLFVSLVILFLLMMLTSGYIFALQSNNNVILQELSGIQSGALLSTYFIGFAILVGLAYALYSFLKKQLFGNMQKLVFLVIVIGVAGLLLSYVYNIATSDWSAASISTDTSWSFVAGALPSLALFIIGYSQILMELPKKAASKMLMEEDKFVAALTLFILFSAIAELLSWSLFGKPGYFLAEVDIIQWLAIPAGVVMIGISKYSNKLGRRIV